MEGLILQFLHKSLPNFTILIFLSSEHLLNFNSIFLLVMILFLQEYSDRIHK